VGVGAISHGTGAFAGADGAGETENFELLFRRP
jgi:hypothetical protein